MGRRRTISAWAATVLVGLATPTLAATAVEADATDTTPPTVALDPYARHLVGSQIQTHYDDNLEVWDASFYLSWRAEDPSGICEQTLAWESYDNMGVGYTALDPAARTFEFHVYSLDYGRIRDRFYLQVTDCAGNTSVSNIAETELGTREDGTAGISYQRSWKVSRLDAFDGYSGGTVHTTRTRGASLTTTFRGEGPVALVMDTGPDQGKADVYVDGVHRATIDTYAAETRHRVVTWEGLYVGGTHTLRVVNQATRGRPHLSFDTLLLCESATRVQCLSD